MKTIKPLKVILLLAFLCQNAFCATWITSSFGLNTDTNLYKYVVPYNDSYSVVDLGFNMKEKLTDTTRCFLNYSFRNSFYNTNTIRNYSEHLAGFNLDEDLVEMLVAGASLQGDYYTTSYSTYNYLNLTAKGYLRYFMFVFDYTNIDVGAKYENFNYPNYNFGAEGFTPSLSYREEVSDYTTMAPFVSIKQGLPPDMDLELNVLYSMKKYPERPLYMLSGTDYVFDVSKNREDTELNINFGLGYNLERNSRLSLSLTMLNVSSNANMTVYDPSVSGTELNLQESYYNRNDMTISFNGLFYFGDAGNYFRMVITSTGKSYGSRKAQDVYGNWSTDSTRSDQMYSATLELNSMLGNFGGLNWMSKLGYTYETDKSNDFYYNYTNETFSLSLSTYLYI